MRVLRASGEFPKSARPVEAAIGVFDGVHVGHVKIIQSAVRSAQSRQGVSVVVTFDRHPNSVVAPNRVPPFIYPLHKRLEVIESLGVDFLWLIKFDDAFSRVTGHDFIHTLAADFAPLSSIVVGEDFHFGYKRSGSLNLLRELAPRLQFEVFPADAASVLGQVVSSTRIRESVQNGNLDIASELLGRPYTLNGKVVRGAQLGRTLGFPTANLEIDGLVTPPPGVYAVQAIVEGVPHPAVLNLGYRPTVAGSAKRLCCEAHLLDFSADLYGCEIEIDWIARLRDERSFAGLEALVAQIRADIIAARGIFDSEREINVRAHRVV